MYGFHVINHVTSHCKTFLTNWTKVTPFVSINLVDFFEMGFGMYFTTEFFVAFQTHG